MEQCAELILCGQKMKKIGGSGFSSLGNSLRLVESIIARTRALSLRHARLLKCKLRKWRSGQVSATAVLSDKLSLNYCMPFPIKP